MKIHCLYFTIWGIEEIKNLDLSGFIFPERHTTFCFDSHQLNINHDLAVFKEITFLVYLSLFAVKKRYL